MLRVEHDGVEYKLDLKPDLVLSVHGVTRALQVHTRPGSGDDNMCVCCECQCVHCSKRWVGLCVTWTAAESC